MHFLSKLKKIVKTVKREARKKKKIPMFSIASTANINNQEILFPSIRETETTICGNILINSLRFLKQIIKEIDDGVKIILVDVETKVPGVIDLESKLRRLVKKSKIFTFKPNDLSVNAADALIAQLMDSLKGKKVTIIGGGNIGSKLALKLVERGANVYLTRRNSDKLRKIVTGLNVIKPKYLKSKVYGKTNNTEASKNADILIGVTPGIAVINSTMIKNMKKSGWVIDIGNGTVLPEAIEKAKKKNIKVVCLFMKPGYDGEIKTILQTEKLIKKQKSKKLGDFSIISGGVFGKRGDIIVDNVDIPSKIIAIADGKGDVMLNTQDARFKKSINSVKRLIEEKIK